VTTTSPHSFRQTARLVASSVWLLVVTVLALLASVGLVGAVIESGYDPQENRAPVARIVVAVLACCAALPALALAAQRLLGKTNRSFALEAALALAAALLIFLLAIVEIASGPL
jgi:hypothetical protein